MRALLVRWVVAMFVGHLLVVSAHMVAGRRCRECGHRDPMWHGRAEEGWEDGCCAACVFMVTGPNPVTDQEEEDA